MRIIMFGFVVGGVWALIQWSRGAITDPIALGIPILLCGAFGGLMWGVRVLVLKFRGKFR